MLKNNDSFLNDNRGVIKGIPIDFLELDLTTPKEFVLNYKHLLLINTGANEIQGFESSRMIFRLPVNSALELYDLITDDYKPLNKIRVFATAGVSTLQVYSFGV